MLERLQAFVVTIARINRLVDQPSRRKSLARRSKSSGWLGSCPIRPKLSTVRTSPSPNSQHQTRLTYTLAVNGFLGLAISMASVNRPLSESL